MVECLPDPSPKSFNYKHIAYCQEILFCDCMGFTGKSETGHLTGNPTLI